MALKQKKRAEGDLAALVVRPGVRNEDVATFIARDAHPQLSPAAVTRALDALSSDFACEGMKDLDDRELATALVHHVSLHHGFRGDEQNYYAAENSYIDGVLRRRRGIPVTLAVIYGAIGERVGIDVALVGFPGRVLTRVGRAEQVLVDPFAGRVLGTADLPELLKAAAGPSATMRPEYLAALTPSELAQRMLLNLKRMHESRNDVRAALLVTDRLLELAATPELRRDRGIYALKLGAHRIAAMDLAHYLLKRPDARDAKTMRSALAEARKDPPPSN